MRDRCPGCGGSKDSRGRLCRECYFKTVRREEEPESPVRVAWRYNCPCGLRAFSFEPHLVIQATCGHDVKRGDRFLYGKT